MERDLAAAIDIDNGGAVEGTLVWLGAFARGEDWRMLKEQGYVADVAVNALRM